MPTIFVAPPTPRQAVVLRDVQRHPRETLEQRTDRIGSTRAAIHATLKILERAGLAERDSDGRWDATTLGRRYLFPVGRPGPKGRRLR